MQVEYCNPNIKTEKLDAIGTCHPQQLGQVENFGTESSVLAKSKDGHVVGVSKMISSSFSRSAKRAPSFNNGTQIVSCLVDGCHSDLSNCKDYHRRHKVREVHSKTTQVTIGGQKQRFCQQCSNNKRRSKTMAVTTLIFPKQENLPRHGGERHNRHDQSATTA
ncbi:hypothetical protein JHK85_045789 [Glycine max]|nr:hypothetical protein JHK85_045789 [Glycine max]